MHLEHSQQPLLRTRLTHLDHQHRSLFSKHSQGLRHLVRHLSSSNNNLRHSGSSSQISLMPSGHHRLLLEDSMHLQLRLHQVRSVNSWVCNLQWFHWEVVAGCVLMFI